jgi:hypothetical protein
VPYGLVICFIIFCTLPHKSYSCYTILLFFNSVLFKYPGLLRRIFGRRREEVAPGWRILHNELHNLYVSPYFIMVIKSRRVRWTGCVVRMGEMRNAHKILLGKSQRNRPCKRLRRRWEGNVRMDVTEMR